MRCILCYNNLVLESNLKTQARKGLFIQHTKWNDCFVKTCAFKSFKHCKSSLKKGEQSIKIKNIGKKYVNKRPNISRIIIFNFFVIEIFFKKLICNK
jgi:hypothetical protein